LGIGNCELGTMFLSSLGGGGTVGDGGGIQVTARSLLRFIILLFYAIIYKV
jgi:hypothetical protein